LQYKHSIRENQMRWLRLGIAMSLFPALAVSQHLSSARGIGLAAFTASADDLSSLDWNPAGLVLVKDWQMNATNFLSLQSNGGAGPVFHNTGIAKRFLSGNAVGIRYAPGNNSEFIIPNFFTVIDSVSNIQAKVDKQISYAERYALGYAFRFDENLSFGVSARYREEEVTDTQLYTVRDSLTFISTRTVSSSAKSWNLNFGTLWEVNPQLRLGLVAENLVKILESEFPEELQGFALDSRKAIRTGVAYAPGKDFLLALDVATSGDGAVGYEWNVLDNLQVRQGFFLGNALTPFVNAATLGLGWSSKTIHADLAYLHFFDRETHSRNVSLSDFTSHAIHDVEFNPFTSDQLRFSVSVDLGRTKEPLARIDYIDVTSDIYPSAYETFAYRPIGRASVRNISNQPIEAKVGFYLKPFMDAPTETKRYLIQPGAVADIPFTAIFNGLIKSVTEPQLRDGDIYVVASPSDDFDDKAQALVRIYGRNNWNGEAFTLRYFMTPTDPDVLRFTRLAISNKKDSLSTVSPTLLKFEQAKLLFNKLAQRLTYVNDPKLTKDWVQYPGETLSLHGGDCDDFTVCFASLLASVGISSAFIDVVPPKNPGDAHIYLMFDTGLEATQADLISKNRKRCVLRKNDDGTETVWVPIETTQIAKGFEEAWATGAKEYLDDVELGIGLIKGWVRIVEAQ
jgi:predicted transglutaminase-like cysteine proteinase